MPRGGRRQGLAGKNYANRTDLAIAPRKPAVPTGQTYGKAGEQQAVIDSMPPPMPAFDRPTERPDEPLTAGLPIGPGPGPEALPAIGDDSLTRTRAVYMRYPDETLRELLEAMEAGEL